MTAAVDATTGVVYRETPERALELDLYRPAGTEPTVGVVFAHGGGWVGGDRDQFERHAIRLARRGYACVTVDYRFATEAASPAAVRDVVAATGWLEAREPTLDRLVLAGGSAGGHLASLAALATDDPAFEPRDGPVPSLPVAAAVAFNPVVDLVGPGEAFVASGRTLAAVRDGGTDGLADSVTLFVGETYADAPSRYERASPVHRVERGAPPFLLLHGTEDGTVPYDSCRTFRDRLADAGVPVELYAAEGAGHGFFNGDPWYERTVAETVAFLAVHAPA